MEDEREAIEQQGNRNMVIIVPGSHNVVNVPGPASLSAAREPDSQALPDAAPATSVERPLALSPLSPSRKSRRRRTVLLAASLLVVAGAAAAVLVHGGLTSPPENEQPGLANAPAGATACRLWTTTDRRPQDGLCRLRWSGQSATLCDELTMPSGQPMRVCGPLDRLEVTATEDAAVLKLWLTGDAEGRLVKAGPGDALWQDTRVLFSTATGVEIEYKLSDVREVELKP